MTGSMTGSPLSVTDSREGTTVHRFLTSPLGLARRRWRERDQRGDVPGWVLVTVMTISIGVGLWSLAQPQLVQILQSALNSVK